MGSGAALALLLPSVTAASGYYVPGIGTRSIGRGAAYVLSADDAGALWVNLGISGMWNVYLDERIEHHTGPGGLLNFRIGYGW